MDKPQLVKRFEQMVDEAERTRMWGEIVVTFQNGSSITLRKTTTEQLINRGGNPHGQYEKR